jgi:poly(ADP-ribose) glycohydrolase
MPCSDRNVDFNGNSNWAKIQNAFANKITSLDDFSKRIQTYNTGVQNMDGLIGYRKSLTAEEQNSFINETIPNIIKLALLMETVFGGPLLYLEKGINASISLTRYQVACLLANGFICSFPGRNNECVVNGFHMGNFNFCKLFEQTSKSGMLKIRCIISYLTQCVIEFPQGIITMSRFFSETPMNEWLNTSKPIMNNVGFECNTGIQDTFAGIAIIDFANKFVGGGILGKGMVQEEILFTSYPELLVAKLLTEKLQDVEVLCFTGAHKFFEIVGIGESASLAGQTIVMEEW